ncbi:MAG TPA: tetratricopeptide repeat protein [Candidatus Saccharimonadales bacterium]|nr:tetratricopeptide repeat protein [Candidatus Saccharimonadales bacterium]
MLSQIIFFVAVALVIILLARRLYSGGAIGQTLNRSAQAVMAALNRLWARTIAQIRQRERVRSGRPTGVPVSLGGEHQFWQEEPMSDKPELSSHFEEGDRLLKEKKYSEAEQFFLKAAANNPKDARAYAKLGLLYLQQKSFSDAIESLKVAVKLDKYNPSRHYNLALAYMGNKDEQKAIASVREAITIDPVTPKYRTLLEQLLNG